LKVIIKILGLIGLSVVLFLTIISCPPEEPTLPAAPSNLTLTSSYPCEIQWTDNSDNEDGFRIYISPSCVNCDIASDWVLIVTVPENSTSYTWTGQSCCAVGECTCVVVRAYNSAGETPSNVTMLAPIC